MYLYILTHTNTHTRTPGATAEATTTTKITSPSLSRTLFLSIYLSIYISVMQLSTTLSNIFYLLYLRICTVYATTGDLAGKVNTGSLKYANNNMISQLQINGARR